ncbi:putative tail fiber protein [Acinetobacter phage phiAC-1]|uniref:putative tail fiber protein n=1 Tax=Acinetobacter phage phiAC-1 TaxID=1229760 RepID=UPI00028A8515|nr:putative tail fiber protein [Acinetobacter phage phiAC-1]AFU62318.1 putative tail fiber protein [Acinetobacter phage phiAC-1]
MTNPTLVTTPFAENGDKNIIPQSIGAEPQNATQDEGFPEVTQTPISAGGIPPERKDINGVFNLYGQHIVHLNKGLPYEFDAAFATKIGGYPLHARIMLSNGDIVVNTTANNTINPNVDLTGWFNESLNLRENISRVKDAATIDLGYLNPPDNFDISATLQSFLNLSSEKPLNIVLPHGTFLMSQPIFAPFDSKGVSIDFNGSTLKPTVDYTSPDWYAIALYSNTNFPVVLKNGELNGELRKQNLFEYTDYLEYQRDSTSGVYAKANTVIFENFKLKNLYGQTTKTGCTHLYVLNSEIRSCGGHWYQNNDYDAFGDLFYIETGYTTGGIITASFENVIAHAKASDQYPENHQSGSPLTQVMYSRSGLVLENFGETNNKVYVSYKNCDIQFTERGIHQEALGINSHVYLENTRYDSCALFGSYLSETMSGFATNCKLGFYGSEYNGSKGLVRGFSGTSKAKLNFCEVTNLATDENYQMLGTSGYLEAYNTKFVGVSNLWADNVTGKLVDCEVDVIKHSSLSYIAWNSSFDMQDVDVTYSGSEPDVKIYNGQTGFFNKLKNITWEMTLPVINTVSMKENFDNVTLIVPNDYNENFKGSRFRVVGKNGLTKNYPEILWGLPEQLIFSNRYVKEIHEKPLSGTLNLYTDAVKALLNRQSVAMIVAKGQDSSNSDILSNISETAYSAGYYVALIKKDSSQPNGIKMVQPFLSVGSTAAAGFDLTIDSSGNVTAYGTYSSYVHVCVFPHKEKGTLPFVPDAMI